MTAPPRSSASRLPVRVPASDIKAAAISAAPIGTLLRKTHRHERPVVRAPPTSAPAIPPTPPAAAHAPNARARECSPVKEALMTASVAGAIMAAPMPCTTRAVPRTSAAVVMPATRLEAENTNTPLASIRRWPHRSATSSSSSTCGPAPNQALRPSSQDPRAAPRLHPHRLHGLGDLSSDSDRADERIVGQVACGDGDALDTRL